MVDEGSRNGIPTVGKDSRSGIHAVSEGSRKDICLWWVRAVGIMYLE